MKLKHMTNVGANKHMATVELFLVSSGVKLVVVAIRVKGRQGAGKRVFRQYWLQIFLGHCQSDFYLLLFEVHNINISPGLISIGTRFFLALQVRFLFATI